MDWNSKPASLWDFTELEQEQFSSLDAANHGFGDHKPGGEDFSVDLKLGHMGDPGSEMADAWKDHSGLAKPGSSPSGTSKRSRGSYGGSQAASCLVDGCNADLSGCRDYHRRHKVCELHSKTPQVTISGHKQRFCQQCSRFHSLEEFDEGKRSCRKRLDGHNRRRRKPQPEPFSRYGGVLSNYTGTQLLPFSSSLVYPSTSVTGPSWGGTSAKPEADSGQLSFFYKQNSLLASSSLSGDRPIPTPRSHSHPLPPPEPSDRDRRAIYGGAPTQVQSSDCALSLLSSPGLGHQGAPMQLGSALPLPGAFHHLGSGEDSHQSLPSHWS